MNAPALSAQALAALEQAIDAPTTFAGKGSALAAAAEREKKVMGSLAELRNAATRPGAQAQAGAVLGQFYSGEATRTDGSPVGGGNVPSSFELNAEDDRFLDEIERRAFLYFWEQTNPKNGLTRDRTPNFEVPAPGSNYQIASLAAVGFGLIALGVGHERGWISRDEAYDRALITLRTFRDEQPNVHGWFYHWLNFDTGGVEWNSEVSTIDTALFLIGALFIGRHFPGTEVSKLAKEIYLRVDFPWMMTDGGAKPDEKTLSIAWTPEFGFHPKRWDSYSEHMILYLLGLGSPTYPLPAASWDSFERPIGSYGGYTMIASGPLFTHQYSHGEADFRGRRDRYADYFLNSFYATLANRQFTLDHMNEYTTYSENCWGLTACDGPKGYMDYGAAPGIVKHDGTIAPAGPAGSIVFTPELSIKALRFMKDTYGDRIWRRYGYTAGFNTDPRWQAEFNAPGLWRSPDVVGIDLGITLIMIENLRSGLVWRTVMGSPYMRRGMRRAGLKKARAPA